jgi:PST family polysaccharide transporter
VVAVLYSAEFSPAIIVLQWQLLGDLLKVMSWPLGFVLLAAGSGKTYIMAEILGVGVMLVGVAVGLPLIGIEATGVAFLVMYLVYLPTIFWLAARRIGFRWSRPVRAQATGVISLAVVVMAAAQWSPLAGAVIATAGGGALALWSLIRIASMSQQIGGERLVRIARLGERVKAWMTKQS